MFIMKVYKVTWFHIFEQYFICCICKKQLLYCACRKDVFFYFEIKSFEVFGITERRNAQITALILTVLFTPMENTSRIVH